MFSLVIFKNEMFSYIFFVCVIQQKSNILKLYILKFIDLVSQLPNKQLYNFIEHHTSNSKTIKIVLRNK